MDNNQERFEAWAKLSSMNLAKDSDGEYVNLAVHGAWSAWQAAQSDVDYINWKEGHDPLPQVSGD
jgi:hypothetical protein